MIRLAVATAVVQATMLPTLGLATQGPWIVLDAVVGGVYYFLLRTARAGRPGLAAGGLIGSLGAMTALLLVSNGPDNPLWAMLGAFTVGLALFVLGGRGALVTLAIGSAVVLPIVALQDAGTLRPILAEKVAKLSDSAITVQMLLLLGVLGWVHRLYAAQPVALAAPVGAAQTRTLTLTPRELEVVRLIAEGQSNGAIAERLVVSPRTVHSHVTNAMRKCGCANRTELGVLAVREGLVPVTPPPAPATARTP